ncbi:hypothetical protein T492DRAFT_890762 [Pavlovales sp. CCMP2436]|nr:hypothetical protein T492DRAFT_890762 [Pavlovales sp. CCMP2436]
MGGSRSGKKCSGTDISVFMVGLISGTGCSLTSKMLLSCTSIGKTGATEAFEFPLFQSWVMFLAMTCALPVHFIYEWYQRRAISEERASLAQSLNTPAQFPKGRMPVWTYFVLAIPSCFDLVATVLCMFGLMYISVSIYQVRKG